MSEKRQPTMNVLSHIVGYLHRITCGRRSLSVSDSGWLLLIEGWRAVRVSWAEVVRVDVWQIDAWVHVIGVDVWLDRFDRPVSVDEGNGGYKQLTAAIAQRLHPFDQVAWDYVHSDFFADVSKTVYTRADIEVEA